MWQARKALSDRQKELELKTQQLEMKLSNKIEEDIKKARRKSTQAGQSQGSKPPGPQGQCPTQVVAVFVCWELSLRSYSKPNYLHFQFDCSETASRDQLSQNAL